MNYITMLKERDAATEEWAQQFRSHLSGDKFSGKDTVKYRCDDCGYVIERQERKDLIAVADVLRWLDALNNVRGAVR